MTVWITQMLCPTRHCAFAGAWDDARTRPEQAEAQVREAMRRVGLTDHCGICGGGLRVEHAPTHYATLAEALPALTESERRNIASRRVLDRLGLTREPLHPGAGSAGATLDHFPPTADRSAPTDGASVD